MSDAAKILTERKMLESMGNALDTPGYDTANLAEDTSLSNLNELLREIDRTRDPKIKAVLMEEFNRIKETMSNLLGPVQKPQLPTFIPPSDVMRGAYDPATQKPGVYGGHQQHPGRFMDNPGPMQRPPMPMPITGRRG